MSERSVTHSSFVIERYYPAAPSRVFATFSDPTKKRRWFAEGEEGTVESFEMDFRVGGRERTRSRMGADTPFPGTPLINDGYYEDIVPERRIVLAYTMTVGEARISASQATFEFLPAQSGTTLIFTEQAAFFAGADGPNVRELGWRVLLDQLAAELER